MSSFVSVSVSLRSLVQEPEHASLEVHELSQGERVRRTAIIWGLMWAIAVVCVLIPFLHFFLVPTFVILGVVLGVRRFQTTALLQPGQITCPQCHKKSVFAGAPLRWPLRESCTECQAQLVLELERK